jgi:hypothetical protein
MMNQRVRATRRKKQQQRQQQLHRRMPRWVLHGAGDDEDERKHKSKRACLPIVHCPVGWHGAGRGSALGGGWYMAKRSGR